MSFVLSLPRLQFLSGQCLPGREKIFRRTSPSYTPTTACFYLSLKFHYQNLVCTELSPQFQTRFVRLFENIGIIKGFSLMTELTNLNCLFVVFPGQDTQTTSLLQDHKSFAEWLAFMTNNFESLLQGPIKFLEQEGKIILSK